MRFPVPGTTVGVVGGGQLGRMLGEAAAPLGIDLIVSDPTPDAPAAPVVRDQVVGAFDDPETIRELAARVDILTYEIELADPAVLRSVSEETDTPVHPHPATLEMIQDKFVQKQAFENAGVPVPPFQAVDSAGELQTVVEEMGPVMLKARSGGYDGRGNVPVETPTAAADAFDALSGPAMAEQFLDFDRELAIMGCRGADETRLFPVTETIHEEEILRSTVSPPRTDSDVIARARSVARDVLDTLSGRGVFGIELFEVDGEIYLNEVAPRPHNSGHWTIEGCHTSQFEQHLRAVVGTPLGDTGRRSPTVSANILGDGDEKRPATLNGLGEVLERSRLAVHWYGKDMVYPLRKMGHLTLVGQDEASDRSELLGAVQSATKALSFDQD